MRPHGAVVRAWIAGVLVALAPGARADEDAHRASSIEWHAPPSCPDGAYVEDAVERARTAAAGAAGPAPVLHVRGEVAQDAAGTWRLSLSMVDGSERETDRTLTSASCRTLADAAALVIALAHPVGKLPDPATAIDAGSSAASVAVRDVSPSDPPLRGSTPADRDARGATRPRTAWDVRAAAGLDIGDLPAPAPGIVAAASLAGPALRGLELEASVALWAPESTRDRSGQSGRFVFRSFAVRACRAVERTAWRAGVCAGPELAWLDGRGVGETLSVASRQAFWPELRVDAAAGYAFAKAWAVRAEVGAAVGVGRPEFVSVAAPGGSGGAIFRPSLVSGLGSLGVELRLR